MTAHKVVGYLNNDAFENKNEKRYEQALRIAMLL